MDAARREHGSRERARSRACERGVGFHENSCRSFEASSSVRTSHLAESESPGRPCNEARVHAGQDSPFTSQTSRHLFSFPSHLLLPPPPLPPPLPPSSSSSSSSAQRARHGTAGHLLHRRRRVSLGPSPLLAPFGTPRSRRQLPTFPPTSSHTFASVQLPTILLLAPPPPPLDLTSWIVWFPYFALLARYDARSPGIHTYVLAH